MVYQAKELGAFGTATCSVINRFQAAYRGFVAGGFVNGGNNASVNAFVPDPEALVSPPQYEDLKT